MTSLPDIARATVLHHSMLPEGAPVLAMVSGGGDSVAMLHLLAAGDLGQHHVRVLHVNHLLRGAESDADERLVVDLCERLGVECRVVRHDVAAFADDERLNLEDAGRRVRQQFAAVELDALCASLGVPLTYGRVVFAHTRDDRVETFFMRAIAGSGTGGLGSIAPTRGRIVRPLIDADRGDVRSWLTSRGHTWREDATNEDTDRTRAYVRNELVPVAEKLNPSMRATLARTMDLLADDDTLLSGMASAFARDFAHVSDGEVAFEVEWMATLDRTMARRTIREALSSAFPDASRLESHHIEALVDGVYDPEFARDLSGGLRAFREYGRLVVSRAGRDHERVAPRLLPAPGKADLGAAGVITVEEADPGDTTGTRDSVVIDADTLTAEMVVDAARDGDRMRPLGMTGSRKLSDMLTDEKVPRRERTAVPVVRDGGRIVWLAGVRMSDEYRVTEQTRTAYRLTWDRASDRFDETKEQADD